MQTLFFTAFLATLIFSLFPMITFANAPTDSSASKDSPAPKEESKEEAAAIRAAESVTKAWLALIDKKQYKEAWDQSSNLMKNTLDLDTWNQVMLHVREPFGTVTSREVADERTAKDPKGLPAGDYMVMFYKTVFSNRPNAYELVTLFYDDGVWRVVTYQVN